MSTTHQLSQTFNYYNSVTHFSNRIYLGCQILLLNGQDWHQIGHSVTFKHLFSSHRVKMNRSLIFESTRIIPCPANNMAMLESISDIPGVYQVGDI